MTPAARPEAYWLPAVEDWPARIAEVEALSGGDPQAWSRLVALAGHRLDFLRTGRLDAAAQRLFGAEPPPDLATRPVRLAVLGSSTTAHLVPAIRVAGLRRGLWVQVHEPDYGQYRQALLDPGSDLHRFQPTAVLLALDARHLAQGADPALGAEAAAERLGAALEGLVELWRAARGAFRCQVVQQTALPVFPALMGSAEHRLPGSPAAFLAGLNAALRPLAAEEGVDLLALDAAAGETGVAAWSDPGLWHRAKQEVSPAAAPLYGERLARILGAAQGRSAKCLVLDLDNTLWGGVVGDDGVEGIVLGQGSPDGEAFAEFQAYAAALSRRGVILAVNSKNDEANARAPFERHPEMVLRTPDISAFLANWDDKASNLREIARRLNIGLDALVFADDNPFERNLVRRELPMVAVPELPDDPALYARTLADAGYFEALSLSEEDRARTAQYAANAEREALAGAATDLGAYLSSLQMTLVAQPFDRIGLQRVVQLINKTNQFNLTTRRHGEAEVAAVIDDPRAVGLQLRLTDRYGDNGVIAVVIGRLDAAGATLELDTWLMSCRVLGRRVEEATLAVVADAARALGAQRLSGAYRPTPKNAMVAEHYPRLGFAALGDGCYALDLAGYLAPADLPIAIRSA